VDSERNQSGDVNFSRSGLHEDGSGIHDSGCKRDKEIMRGLKMFRNNKICKTLQKGPKIINLQDKV
jgi:hypothetical protein